MKSKTKKYTHTFLLVLFAMLFTNCKKDFLEITPKGKVIASTVNDYQLLLNNLELLDVGTLSHVMMGDDVAALNKFYISYSLRYQRLFSWSPIIYEPNDDAVEMLLPMKNIYIYNKVINEVLNSSDGTEQEKKSIRAQAMVGRAWTNFLLINFYGLPYNELTSSTDPGFPIVKLADVNANTFERASVKEVYEFILSDLKAAIPDLPAQPNHRLQISSAAANGILGKVYVFMHKYDLAVPHLKATFEDLEGSALEIGLYDYNETFGPDGIFVSDDETPTYPTASSNIENVFAKQFFNDFTFYSNDLLLDPETYALFSESDLRLKFFVNNPVFSSDEFPSGFYRKNLPTVQFGLVVPDIYLLLAESLARVNELSAATTAVETLRKNRMSADFEIPEDLANNQEKLVKMILQERQREFAISGYRWFDMRRLSVDPIYKTTVGYKHHVYNENGEIIQTFTLSPERFAFRFPQKIIDQNPGMKNNP